MNNIKNEVIFYLGLKDDIQYQISLPKDKVQEFSKLYYPLTQNTIDIFTSNMSKEVKKSLKEHFESGNVDLEIVQAVYLEQLDHCLALAKTEA